MESVTPSGVEHVQPHLGQLQLAVMESVTPSGVEHSALGLVLSPATGDGISDAFGRGAPYMRIRRMSVWLLGWNQGRLRALSTSIVGHYSIKDSSDGISDAFGRGAPDTFIVVFNMIVSDGISDAFGRGAHKWASVQDNNHPVMESVTPSGVEHTHASGMDLFHNRVMESVTPSGVEHYTARESPLGGLSAGWNQGRLRALSTRNSTLLPAGQRAGWNQGRLRALST